MSDWDLLRQLRRAPLVELGPLSWVAADVIEQLLVAGDALAAVMRSGSDAGWDAAVDAWDVVRTLSTR